MKNPFPFLLLISLLTFSFTQKTASHECEVVPFEAYIDDEDQFSNIRATPGGDIVLKLNVEYTWGYIVNIIDAKDGWFKINAMNGIDEYYISNFEGWVHHSIVGAAVTHDLDVLDQPNGKKKVGKLIGEQDTFKILDAQCEWIKIQNEKVTGWVKSADICGNPVTTCP